MEDTALKREILGVLFDDLTLDEAACRGAALEAGQLYGWKRLSCLDEGGALRDVEEIHEEIWQAVRPLLSGREKA